MILLEAFSQIADKTYENEELSSYEAIPFNKSGLIHDLILREVEVEQNNNWYKLDIGMRRFQIPTGPEEMTFLANVSDLGDLHNFFAYHEFEGKGYRAIPGKVYQPMIKSLKQLKKLDLMALFEEGYTDFRLKKLPEYQEIADLPISVAGVDDEISNDIKLGRNPTLFLEKDGKKKYVVISGKLFDLEKVDKWFRFQLMGE